MNNYKPILAVETSSDLCSIAVMLSEVDYISYEIKQKHIHSEKLIPMIQYVLEAASLKIVDLSYIAISVGPGSFTGLRIGMSAVKGLAFGSGIGICPVPAFEAFANMICGFIPEKQTFVIARNVNVDEIYTARFVKENNLYKALTPLDIIKKSDFNSYISKDDLTFGNYLPDKKENAIKDVDAVSVARWSYTFGQSSITNDYDYLEPDYIKKFEGRKL